MVFASRSWQFPFLAVALFAGWSLPWSSLEPAQRKSDTEGWYAPIEADFRPEYDRDTVNQKVQSWTEYWGWIRQFYAGNFLSEGWTKQGRACVAVVKGKAVRDELIKMLNELGKEIAKEWAKDNGIRKISTVDLQRWGSTLRSARIKDNGTGHVLKATLQAIRQEAEKKLGV